MDDSDRRLWELLGRSPRAAAPPFFAARVMRAIRPSSRQPAWAAAFLRWLAPAAIAALVAAAMLPRPAETEAETAAKGDITTLDLVEIVNPDDYATLTSAGWPFDNGFLTAGL